MVVVYNGASATAKAALFSFRFQPFALLLRLLQTLSCFSRIPSSVARGIIAAARHRIDNIGLAAAGASRAFRGHGACSSAGGTTLFPARARVKGSMDARIPTAELNVVS